MSDKLTGLHPDLIIRVKHVLAAMAALGHPMIVTDGVRTDAQQVVLYAKGRTLPGRIVTNADGLHKRSNHQTKADGYGYAVDCTFLDATGVPTWDEALPWNAYGACAKALGLVWGGDFKSLVDKPHIELPIVGR